MLLRAHLPAGQPRAEADTDDGQRSEHLPNITIPTLGIDKDIPPKGQGRLDVTIPAPVVLTFSCKFHGPLGMHGMPKTE